MSDVEDDVLVQQLHLPANEEAAKAQAAAEAGSEIPVEDQAPPEIPENMVDPSTKQGPPPAPGQEPLFTECAFLMFLTPEGHWAADTNLTRQVTSARPASFNDFFHAACTVKKDIEASEAAQRVLIGQQNMAQHLQQQLETANIAKQMGGPVGQGLMDFSQLKRR